MNNFFAYSVKQIFDNYSERLKSQTHLLFYPDNRKLVFFRFQGVVIKNYSYIFGRLYPISLIANSTTEGAKYDAKVKVNIWQAKNFPFGFVMISSYVTFFSLFLFFIFISALSKNFSAFNLCKRQLENLFIMYIPLFLVFRLHSDFSPLVFIIQNCNWVFSPKSQKQQC